MDVLKQNLYIMFVETSAATLEIFLEGSQEH